MTKRPAFFPDFNRIGVDDSQSFEFVWNPGFAPSQKQKNVKALHEAICKGRPDCRPLEVSSKSTEPIGCMLSAMNLSFTDSEGQKCTVESVFQASKVFANGGPFPERYASPPRDVRIFLKENCFGPLTGFEYEGIGWDLNPTRAFYDWVYLNALRENCRSNEDFAWRLNEFDCFTDIEFNPKKSLNCQAYAVALYLSFEKAGFLDEALAGKEAFLEFHPNEIVKLGTGINRKAGMEEPMQGGLFDSF